MQKKVQTSPSSTTYLRFLTSLLLDFPIIIYLDEYPICKKLEYGLFSKYLEISSGNHMIKFVNSLTQDILLEKRINLRPYSIFTYTLTYKSKEDSTTFHLLSIEENFRLCAPDKCFIRLHHLSSSTSPILLSCKSAEFNSSLTNYTNSSRYTVFAPTLYDFCILKAESDTALYMLKKVKLKPERFYSFYFIGEGTNHCPYQILRSIDGNSYLEDKSPQNAQ